MNKENSSIFKNRPLAKALTAFVGGIVFSTVLELNYLYSLIPFMMASIIALYFYWRNKIWPAGIAICAMLFFLGWFRADLSQGPFPPNHIENLADPGGKARVFGKIVEEPDIREDRTYLVIEADSVAMKGYTIPSLGRLRARVPEGGSRYDHSDIVIAEGYLYPPEGPRNPGGFDYAKYLQSKNIFAAVSVNGPHDVSIIKEGSSFLSSIVKPIRTYMIETARENLTPVSAAILSGFILGERRDIPKEYESMFRDTGTLHLMAVSGSNVGLIIGVIALPLTLAGLRRKLKVVILLTAVVLFAVLTRLEPSVVRASIMAMIGLLAYGWLRKPDYINLLAFAGLLMLFWRPLQLFDVGLQLSFAATFGIVYAVPDIYERIKPFTRKKLRWFRWIVTAIVTTIAAQVAVMPLMALYFNNFPLTGLVANIPIGSLAYLASSLGISFYFFSALGGWLEYVAAEVIELIMNLIGILLQFFSHFPLAAIKTAAFGWPAIFLYWIAGYMAYEFIFKRRLSVRGIIIGLFFLNLLIWPKVFENKPGWAIEYIDVGLDRAWIYSDDSGQGLGCFDIYGETGNAENVLIPYILNFHDGRLKWLVTSTPESGDIKSIKEMFSPIILNMNDSIGRTPTENSKRNKNSSEYPQWIKFVWGRSDNIEEGSHNLPCVRIDAGNYLLLMAGRSGTQGLREIMVDKRIALLELPWGVYARTECKDIIESLDPECVVFSPDRHTRYAPRRRPDLTHSADRIFSTSICGGFRVIETGDTIQVNTMRSYGFQE